MAGVSEPQAAAALSSNPATIIPDRLLLWSSDRSFARNYAASCGGATAYDGAQDLLFSVSALSFAKSSRIRRPSRHVGFDNVNLPTQGEGCNFGRWYPCT